MKKLFLVGMLLYTVHCAWGMENIEVKTETGYTFMTHLLAKESAHQRVEGILVESKILANQDTHCIEYRIHEGIKRSQAFCLYEKWKSGDDREAFYKTDKMIALWVQLQSALSEEQTTNVLRELTLKAKNEHE